MTAKNDSDACYVVDCNKYFENYIDMEKLKKIKVLPEDQRNHCECDTRISKSVLLNVVKPVLEVMFKKANFQITTKILKDKVVSELFGQYPMKFKRDLNVINIEWCVDKFFKEGARDKKGSELELQLTG